MEHTFTTDGIDAINDIGTAYAICETYGIPIEELKTLEEIVKRLKMHYLSKKHGNYWKMISESIARDGKEDNAKRQQLSEMFQKLLRIVQPSDESQSHKFVHDFLFSDGTTDNILKDCNKRILELEKDEAVLIVAGETNAGKSSFLNLLLGTDILPVHNNSCTSLITSVRYGPRRLFKVIYKDQSKPIFETESLEEFQKIAFPRGKERERDHGVKEARVYVPLDILKGGLVLTDSPGIGENDFLEAYLMEYIAENDILGFIYIIFSDNAGGVQEDRLLQLLKLVIQEQKKNDKALPFDPKAALFVTNRFDAVEESSKETVKDHITSKLKSCYPQFDDSKIVFFSTQNAKRDITAHPDYISDNFRNLLDTLSRLYSYITERRLRVYYKSLLSTDSHLAEFLGIHHSDAIIPAYIFDQRLVSLSKFLNNIDKPETYFHKVLLETASGLFNLHSKGLVHMEFSQHTITVTEQGDVKLTGACVPRKASLPIDGEAKVGNFVYLPHEVLNDELYITSGDVYGFGLLMYELMYNRLAFEAQRSYRIRDFVRDLNPDAMLGLDQDSGGLPDAVVRLVQICLKKLNSERSTISTVLNQLQAAVDDLSKASRRTSREACLPPPRRVFCKNMQ